MRADCPNIYKLLPLHAGAEVFAAPLKRHAAVSQEAGCTQAGQLLGADAEEQPCGSSSGTVQQEGAHNTEVSLSCLAMEMQSVLHCRVGAAALPVNGGSAFKQVQACIRDDPLSSCLAGCSILKHHIQVVFPVQCCAAHQG